MAVRIRMKKMGRAHRPYFRICAMDQRAPRDGKVLEELGTYDPMIPDTDARVRLNTERVDYWIGVGAQPSEKVAVLIKKYGAGGTHVAQQAAATEKMAQPREVPAAGAPVLKEKSAEEIAAEEAAAQAATETTDQTQSAEESAVETTPADSPEAVTPETTEDVIQEAETPADTQEKPIE